MHPLFVLDLVAGLDRCTETGVVLLARGITLNPSYMDPYEAVRIPSSCYRDSGGMVERAMERTRPLKSRRHDMNPIKYESPIERLLQGPDPRASRQVKTPSRRIQATTNATIRLYLPGFGPRNKLFFLRGWGQLSITVSSTTISGNYPNPGRARPWRR